jgi:hypothetical protein
METVILKLTFQIAVSVFSLERGRENAGHSNDN